MITGIKAWGMVGVGAVIATMVASGGPVEPENAALPTPRPSTLETTQKSAESVILPKITPTPSQIEPAKPTASNCHPGYSGCLKMNAGDYDCAGGSGNGPNYTGPVRVYGSDPFDLDRDNDGWGCE